jgi:parvulin-like peptidyl-prolyl isomerase
MILLVLFLLLLFTTPLSAQTVDKILAVVNGEIITQSDVQRLLATIEAELKAADHLPEDLERKLEQVRGNIINQMVEEKLVLSAARRYGIKIEEQLVDARIEQIRRNFPDEEAFEQALEIQGLSLHDLRTRFHDQELMKKAVDYFVRAKIKIHPQKLQQYYQEHQAQLIQPQRARLESLLFKAEDGTSESLALEQAEQALSEIKKGADLKDAQELGFIEQGQLIQEIDEAVFSLNPGEFTDVIKTESGYRIFRVIERMPAQPLTFSQAQKFIGQILEQQQFTQIFKEWLQELKEEADIRYCD